MKNNHYQITLVVSVLLLLPHLAMSYSNVNAASSDIKSASANIKNDTLGSKHSQFKKSLADIKHLEPHQQDRALNIIFDKIFQDTRIHIFAQWLASTDTHNFPDFIHDFFKIYTEIAPKPALLNALKIKSPLLRANITHIIFETLGKTHSKIGLDLINEHVLFQNIATNIKTNHQALETTQLTLAKHFYQGMLKNPSSGKNPRDTLENINNREIKNHLLMAFNRHLAQTRERHIREKNPPSH